MTLPSATPTSDASPGNSLPSASPLPNAGPAAARSLTLAVFDEVLRALAHGESTHETLHLLADKARLLTDSASSAIGLLDPDRETLTFVAASGGESKDLLGSRVHLADTIVGSTARSGEPYLAFRPHLTGVDSTTIGQPVISAAVVPIFDEARPVGALASLNRAGGAPFGGDDLMALTTLAAAASITLRNGRLQANAQRQSRELSLLYDAVRSVSGKLSAQEVLHAVVDQASALLENSAVAVFLANDERTHLYIAEDVGLDPDLREVTLSGESGLGAAALGTSLPLFLAFPDADTLEEPLPRDGRREGDGSLLRIESPFPSLGARGGLVAAVRSGEIAHGLLLVLTGQPPEVYTPADANLISALASQAAVAMENSWLYEDATRRAEEAAALYELSQAVTSTLRLPQVLDHVADSVLSLLGVDKFALFLHDAASDRLQMVVERGLPPGAAERVRPPVGQGIPGWVMEFETPTAVQDVAADHRNAAAPLHAEGVVSMTCMPLQVGVSAIGVLCAMSSRRRLFTVAEMELLYTIANQAAIAIENARVYADIRHKSRELRKSFDRVARALGSSRAPGAVPELIASLTQEMTGADYCALYSVAASPAPGGRSAAENGRRLVLEGAVGFRTAADTPEMSGDSPTAWVARKGRSLAIADIDADERFRGQVLRPARGRARGYLGVPLRPGGGADVVGVLEVYTRSPRHWRADEGRLLLTFASQAAVAFQNANLVGSGQRAARRAKGLGSLLEMLVKADAPVVPTDVLAAIRTATGAAGGIAALRRDPGGVWRVLGADGIAPEAAEQIASSSSEDGPSDGWLSVTSDDEKTYVFLEDNGSSSAMGEETRTCLRAAVNILTHLV